MQLEHLLLQHRVDGFDTWQLFTLRNDVFIITWSVTFNPFVFSNLFDNVGILAVKIAEMLGQKAMTSSFGTEEQRLKGVLSMQNDNENEVPDITFRRQTHIFEIAGIRSEVWKRAPKTECHRCLFGFVELTVVLLHNPEITLSCWWLMPSMFAIWEEVRPQSYSWRLPTPPPPLNWPK